MIEGIFASFTIAALMLFLFTAPPRAVLVTCFIGWLLLPVGNFPAGSASAVFPYWITGAALPSDMLLTKIWWPPVTAVLGCLMVDRKRLAALRPNWIDVPMGCWCAWPIIQRAFVQDANPEPWLAVLYLMGSWGAPWVLGRAYFGGFEGARSLLWALVAGLIVIVPIAVIEGIIGPRVYGWVYEPHPFRFDGQERYFGFRPLAFFENGNQYGIWVAVTAFAAVWLCWSAASSRNSFWPIVVAMIGVSFAFASQSIGAIGLLLAGLAFSCSVSSPAMRRSSLYVLVLSLVGLTAYLSGRIPFREVAEQTAIGHRIVDLLRILGRGSLTWRIARDQSSMPLIREHLILGTAQFDWWRNAGQRPWGLLVLITGQFGLVGLALAFSSLIAPIALFFLNSRTVGRSCVSVALATIVLMALGDAFLNSFIFYPAILASGGLGTMGLSSASPNCVQRPVGNVFR